MNKRVILDLLIFSISIFPGFSEETITLDEIWDSHQYKFMRDLPFGGIKEFPGLEIKLLTYSEDINPPALLGAFYNNQFIALYGVMYGTPPDIYFVYDNNGDGIFEYNAKTQYFIPPWITYKMNIPRNRPDDFIKICSEIYFMYNSNEGVNNQRITEIFNGITKIINTETEPNRDIYYSFIQYFIFYTHYPEVALNIILALGDHVVNTTDIMVPLIMLYAGECLIKIGNNEKALGYFTGLKNLDNTSIVAEYYISKLTDQKNNTNKNAEEFKIRHPNFWMDK
jgi:hypothetical protein